MKKVLGLFVIIVSFFLVYLYMDKSLEKPVPLIRESTAVIVNLEEFIHDSLPLPIDLKSYDNYQIKFLSINGIASKNTKLDVAYNAIISKNGITDKCIIVLTYTFYLSDGNLNLSTIEIDYSNSKGRFLLDLKENDEFIIGGIEENWKINHLSLPTDCNEIIELSTNKIIVR